MQCVFVFTEKKLALSSRPHFLAREESDCNEISFFGCKLSNKCSMSAENLFAMHLWLLCMRLNSLLTDWSSFSRLQLEKRDVHVHSCPGLSHEASSLIKWMPTSKVVKAVLLRAQTMYSGKYTAPALQKNDLWSILSFFLSFLACRMEERGEASWLIFPHRPDPNI